MQLTYVFYRYCKFTTGSTRSADAYTKVKINIKCTKLFQEIKLWKFCRKTKGKFLYLCNTSFRHYKFIIKISLWNSMSIKHFMKIHEVCINSLHH